MIKSDNPKIDKFFSKPSKIWIAPLFFVLAFFIYAPAMHGPFVFDDYGDIVENRHLHITSITFDSLMGACVKAECPNRPVANISFALDYYFHGLNPFWFRAVNIAIHILASFFLFLLFKTTLNLPCFTKRSSDLAPFFGALIFLVHPVNTQAVSYIVQRMTSMAAMFYILCMLLYVKGRIAGQRKTRVILYVLAASSFFLAIGSKEIAVTLPVVILMYEWFFLQNLKWDWPRQNLSWLAGGAMLFCAMGLVFVYFHPFDISDIFFLDTAGGSTTYQRMLTQFRVVIFYISLLFWPLPTRMNLDHDFLVSTGFLSPPGTLACAFLIAALIGWAVLRARKERVLSFCILWFFGNLVIESTVVGLEMVFEHRLYLPSMFIASGFVYILSRIVKNRHAAIGVLCVIAIFLSASTWQRNFMWSGRLALWKDCVEKSPAKARTNFGYGKALEEADRLGEAIIYYKKALSIDPAHVQAHNHLGLVLARAGMTNKGIAHIRQSIQYGPDNSKAYNNLGMLLAKKGMHDEALAYIKTAIILDPENKKAYNNAGVVCLEISQFNDAASYFESAIKLNPGYPEAMVNLAVSLAHMGENARALAHINKVLELSPDFEPAKIVLEYVRSCKDQSLRDAKNNLEP